MEELKKMVIGLGVMNDDGLRRAKDMVTGSSAPARVKELITTLISFYLTVGEDPGQRGRAAAACLTAIAEIEGRGPRSSSSSSSYSSGSRAASGGTSAGKVLLSLLLVLGGGIAIWLAAR